MQHPPSGFVRVQQPLVGGLANDVTATAGGGIVDDDDIVMSPGGGRGKGGGILNVKGGG